MEVNNILKNLPEHSDIEIFENIFVNEDVTIERIASYGNVSPHYFWYNQSEDEWVMLVSGEAEIEFKDKTFRKLKAGDYLYIPAYKEHRVSFVSKDPNCIWLAFHFKNKSE